MAVTPGWLRSELMLELFGATEENWLAETEQEPHFVISESPRFVGRPVITLASDPNVGRYDGKSTSSGELAKVYGFTDIDGSRPDAWRHIVEVQDARRPPDATGYR